MAKKNFRDFAENWEPRALLRMEFEEAKFPFLLSMSSLLYDIELLHDVSVILSYPEYEGTRMVAPYFFFRNGRPIRPDHMARAAKVVKQSPLTLEVAIAAVGGLWVLVQIVDKVSNWSLNRKKLRLEIEKLEYETALKQLELADSLTERINRFEAERVEQQLVSRLEASEFRLTDMSVRPFDYRSDDGDRRRRDDA
jgi:hypothetical protein